MIVKPCSDQKPSSDPRIRSGADAEKQMAFYLHRAFANGADILVLNDLRFVDENQPDPSGSPGVCQIDHLVVHRYGMFIIESKSVTDQVTVKDDGTGGDEWTRRFNNKETGFPSPIKQAQRQAEFMRAFLQRHREQLLGKVAKGIRTFTKLVAGTDQRGFTSMPIQISIAISDSGKIVRVHGWKEPDEPFQVFVSKADLVPDKVTSELAKHRESGNLLGGSEGEYGVWLMKGDETAAVAEFLRTQHTPRGNTRAKSSKSAETTNDVSASEQASPPPSPSTPSCKSCRGANLTAHWGKFGYYWKCGDCGTNTSMPTVCSACGAEGHRGKVVRIRKDGPIYFRCCDLCGTSELIWGTPL